MPRLGLFCIQVSISLWHFFFPLISMYCFLTDLLKHFLVYYIFSHVFNLCYMYTLNFLISTTALALSRNFSWLSEVYVYSLLIVSYSFECIRLYLNSYFGNIFKIVLFSYWECDFAVEYACCLSLRCSVISDYEYICKGVSVV